MATADTPEISEAQPGDECEVRACVEAAYFLYLERMSKPPAPMLDDYEDLIRRKVIHLARIDGRLMGLIVMWPEPDHLYIDNIAVHPDSQGTGVGATLLEHAERIARNAGRPEIRLYTNVMMAENIDYYPRRGFEETHRATEAGYERVYFCRKLSGRS